MTWRQRRKAGATIRNLIATAKELKLAGELEVCTDSEAAAAIMTKLLEGNAEVMADPQFDFDGLLAFIERLLPLILKLLELFGGL